MTVSVFEPQISVILLKMVTRTNGVAQRYAGAQRQIDLTPFLGDTSVVQTKRSLADPVGTFSISFLDQVLPTINDSAYALIEPMDMIEIRMARNPSLYAGGKLPIKMRGFVSSISRVETIGDDGSPARQVVITGQNFGKLWQINSIFWQIAYSQDLPLLTLWRVNAITGMDVAFESASVYMQDFVNKVMNPKIAQMAAFANRQVLPFTTNCTVNQGQVTPPAMTTLSEGNYWSILTTFMDSPWNELFIQDIESGPQLVFRPTPYKDLNGIFIMPGAVDPGTVAIDISDVTSISVARSDDNVANYFWVDPNTSSLDTDAIVQAANIVNGFSEDFDHPNNDPALYGYRQMQGQTMLFPDSAVMLPSDLPPDQQGAGSDAYIEWWQLRALQLLAMNRDNAVLESGKMTVKGYETLFPGMYLQLTRGAIVSEAYIVEVQDNFAPFQTYTCDVLFERGTGFLERDKYAGSPMWAEGRNGPYDPASKVVSGALTKQSSTGGGS